MSAAEEYYIELLAKLLGGTISSQERDALLRFAEADPDKAYLLEYLSEGRINKEDRLEAEIVYEKTLPNDLHAKPEPPSITVITRKSRKKWTYLLVAACFACLFGLFWAVSTHRSSVEMGEEWEQTLTEKGERKFLRMSDGTEIWLNSESSLKVKKGYGKKHRELILQGEAYFSVTKNEKLPLHVYTTDAEIEVLGTVFNVRAYPDEKKVTTSLIEGKVKLHIDGGNRKRDYTLTPGDKVEVPNKHFIKQTTSTSFEKTASPSIMEIEDVVQYKKIAVENEEALELLWIDNKLVFNGDPLEDMIRKMERWYNRTIVIENESLKEEHFSGIFQERTAEQVLDLLQRTGENFSYSVENGIIYIK